MRQGDREALAHIRDCLRWLRDVEAPAGMADPGPARLAVARCVEEIAEAASTVDRSIRDRHPEIEWDLLADARRWLRSDFRHVDHDLLDEAVRRLLQHLERLVTSELGPPVTVSEIGSRRGEILDVLSRYDVATGVRVLIPGLIRGDVAFLVRFGDRMPRDLDLVAALGDIERQLAWLLDCGVTVTDMDVDFPRQVAEAYASAETWPL